jgi:hypothetical protein
MIARIKELFRPIGKAIVSEGIATIRQKFPAENPWGNPDREGQVETAAPAGCSDVLPPGIHFNKKSIYVGTVDSTNAPEVRHQ